ncbi:alpha/beta-hydrolase [Obba rivulosa]|uniref:Alpha/beta-hydrolase n=1 Tax=Obba rivulosa TaxID=1052685 RepID=A0A8E2AT23_9APHY|nr:alpha/beta-hydrolase [Obba rivulosa]
MVNSLTRQAGLKLGPIVLETLVKHYFERILKDCHEAEGMTQLRQDELLYDAAFNVVKAFMEAAAKHTIEEIQSFSNTRTPAPPWVHVVRLIVPMPCCDAAAVALIRALGGEEHTKRVVGGTKWWQVRGVRGVSAEWITAKKDWQEAKRRHRERERGAETPKGQANGSANSDTAQEIPASYEPEMDEMPCVLYAHGGGYYFGSIDQERYAIQRYARKINGRVFTINYRLAPQYPFPCAIQDLVAAYLFLIDPPAGSLHRPVKPAHIVVAGDSAGGGLCLALLQVLRDAGLPLPAGGVLISPWCDLTHAFPSIHTNTATDVLPRYGLSFHKPSTLWPPPSDEVTTTVHGSIRTRIRQAVHMSSSTSASPKSAGKDAPTPTALCTDDHVVPADSSGRTLHLGSTASLPAVDPTVRDQAITLRTKDGEVLTIEDQIHMYAPNYLLNHPLVSPVVSYLGGLPPLLVIASDREVLRDEIIYMAHKAAYPDRYPVKEEARKMYPALEGIEQRFGPTKVHLQVYDDTAHVLPILFSFTTPAKYCYRAIATFTKYVTGRLVITPTIDVPLTTSPPSTPEVSTADLSDIGDEPQTPTTIMRRENSSPSVRVGHTKQRSGMRRALSERIPRASLFRRQCEDDPHVRDASGSSDVAGNRFGEAFSTDSPRESRKAGEPSVYFNGLTPQDTMIRERVSTHGVIRSLEPEDDLSALKLPLELIGVVSERAMRRYQDGRAYFAKKFSKASTAIAKARRKNLDRARRDTMKNMAQLQSFIAQEQEAYHSEDEHVKDKGKEGKRGTFHGIKEGLATGSWSWAWALDMDEHPPPSSIVARRDTEEARELAKIADQAVLADEHALSANNLWSLIVDFLTLTPDRHKHGGEYDSDHDQNQDRSVDHSEKGKEKGEKHIHRAFLSRLVPDRMRDRQSEEKPSRESSNEIA